MTAYTEILKRGASAPTLSPRQQAEQTIRDALARYAQAIGPHDEGSEVAVLELTTTMRAAGPVTEFAWFD